MKKPFFLLLLPILLVSCSFKEEKSSYAFESIEKKDELEKFFRYLLFWEGGVYTLLGSKPITTFDILETEESSTSFLPKTSQYLNYTIYINKDKKEDLKFYESLKKEEKDNVILLPDEDYIFDSLALWKSWEVFSTKITISKKYCLFKRTFSSAERKDQGLSNNEGYHIVFVNVLKTACLLEEYYDLFKKVFGRDFNPLEEVLDIENPESSLWKCLYCENPEDHYQEIGLLLGYGWENSLIFKWKYQKQLETASESALKCFLDELESYPSENLKNIIQNPHPFSIRNFLIPVFSTFSFPDLTRKQYKEEKKQIMNFYNGKDFVETTLDILSKTH